MNRDAHQNEPASRHGAVDAYKSRKTGTIRMNDMTGLIIATIAAAIVAGLLVLPVTMPGTGHPSARADDPVALGKGPASFEA